MGLFDGMLSGSGDASGWLSQLLQNPDMMNQGAIDRHAVGGPWGQQPSASPVQMFGANQPSPMDAAQWPSGPIGAPQLSPQAQTAMAQGSPQQAQPMQQSRSLDESMYGGTVGGAPQPPVPTRPMQQQEPGIMDRLTAGASNFTTGGNPIAGILNSISGLATGQRTDRSGMAQQAQTATMQALMRSGVPPAIAQAAALNPDILKQIAPTYFDTAPKLEKLKNPLGGEDAYFYSAGGGNPKLVPANGGAGGFSVGGGPGNSTLAPGVRQFNDNLTGQERFDQYHPDIQAVAKAYLNGDQMPTGNPRIQGIMPFAKTVATRYAADMGIPFNDNTYQAKRKMQTDLAASSNSSMGGILANGKSAFGHLALAAEDSVGLGNANSVIPHLDSIKNYTGNVLLPSSETKGKLAAARDSLGKFGTESTKFYAGTGGGVEERTAALKNNNPDTASGEQQASFFETEKRLMLERLDQKEAQIKDVLGEQYLKDHPVRDKLFEHNLARVDAAIAKLRKGGSDNAAPQAAPNPYEAEMRKRGLLK